MDKKPPPSGGDHPERPRITQDWVDQNLGITCEQCGSDRFLSGSPIKATIVTNTYKRKGMILRRRVCRQCGHVMITEEKRVV